MKGNLSVDGSTSGVAKVIWDLDVINGNAAEIRCQQTDLMFWLPRQNTGGNHYFAGLRDQGFGLRRNGAAARAWSPTQVQGLFDGGSGADGLHTHP